MLEDCQMFLGQNKNSSYPPIISENNIIVENQHKAESFNQYFLEQSNLDTSSSVLPNDQFLNHQFNDMNFTEEDIYDLIRGIDISKANGPDLISPRMLKEAGQSIVPSLKLLFKLSMDTSTFPQIWKQANVIPLFKKDDPSFCQTTDLFHFSVMLANYSKELYLNTCIITLKIMIL